MRTLMPRIALAAATLGALAAPHAASAWERHYHPRWYGGFYVAPPVEMAPSPYYYAPPYYAPPAPAASGGCYAGPYVCPLNAPAYAGQSCACDTDQGRVWGQAR